MKMPNYIDLKEARSVLAEMGLALSDRQMKRAAEQDAYGKRKLPFFIDPIDKRLKIEKGTLVRIYREFISGHLRVQGHGHQEPGFGGGWQAEPVPL